jgi:LysM repeat protein
VAWLDLVTEPAYRQLAALRSPVRLPSERRSREGAMKEADRKARNSQRLTEMDDPMSVVVRRVLNRMEAEGFRPRIQEAFRTPADQLKAFLSGHSKVKFGFHNVTGAGGVKESLAVDVLDDDHPLGPPTRYMLALAIAAHAEGVHTGISFSLPAKLAAGVAAAIADGDINRKVKVGFDPTHVEPVGISIAQAKAGKRPTFGAASAKKAVAKKAAAGGQKFHAVVRGETLFGIAKQFSLTFSRILELNPQKRANPNFLKIGEKIRVA